MSEGMTGEVQKLANEVIDSAQSLANHTFDLGEEAAQAAVSVLATTVKVLTDTLEKVANSAVGKKE